MLENLPTRHFQVGCKFSILVAVYTEKSTAYKGSTYMWTITLDILTAALIEVIHGPLQKWIFSKMQKTTTLPIVMPAKLIVRWLTLPVYRLQTTPIYVTLIVQNFEVNLLLTWVLLVFLTSDFDADTKQTLFWHTTLYTAYYITEARKGAVWTAPGKHLRNFPLGHSFGERGLS